MRERESRSGGRARCGSAARRGGLAGLHVLGSLLTVTVLAACGGGVPEGSVAVVGGDAVERGVFDRTVEGAARAQQQSLGARPETVAVPDPPRFDRCAATLRARPRRRGQRIPPVEQARKACRAVYDSLRREAMSFLIKARWLEQEAEARGVEVSEEQTAQRYRDRRRSSFPDDRAYQQFLAQSGQREEDLRYRARLELLRDRVRENVTAGERDPRAALVSFAREFERRHRKETVCARGFEVGECRNGPPVRPAPRGPR